MVEFLFEKCGDCISYNHDAISGECTAHHIPAKADDSPSETLNSAGVSTLLSCFQRSREPTLEELNLPALLRDHQVKEWLKSIQGLSPE